MPGHASVPLKAKRWGVRRAPRKPRVEGLAHPKPVTTKNSYSLREREWGRMAYARSFACDVWFAYAEEFGPLAAVHAGIGPCHGRQQYMHLHLEEGSGKRAQDDQGAIGCEGHHHDIDGDVGGKGRWYVALGDDGQLRLKRRLVARQRARWDSLSTTEQAFYQKLGAARFGRKSA